MGIARLFFKRFFSQSVQAIRPHNERSGAPPATRAPQEVRRSSPMNPLNSVKGAITTGVILALLLALAISPTAFNEFQLARWLHILAGVMWIGLLYYFNVVQTPGLAAAAADKGG